MRTARAQIERICVRLFILPERSGELMSRDCVPQFSPVILHLNNEGTHETTDGRT